MQAARIRSRLMQRGSAFSVMAGGATLVCTAACCAYYWRKAPTIHPTISPAAALKLSRWSPQANEEIDLQLLGTAFGKGLIVQVFKDEAVVHALTRLLVKTFTDPRVTQELSAFFKHQFSSDEETIAALKQFLVDDVLGDAWVKDALLGIVLEIGDGIKTDPQVWPGPTLNALGDVSLEALKTERFQEEALKAVRSALHHVRLTRDKAASQPKAAS